VCVQRGRTGYQRKAYEARSRILQGKRLWAERSSAGQLNAHYQLSPSASCLSRLRRLRQPMKFGKVYAPLASTALTIHGGIQRGPSATHMSGRVHGDAMGAVPEYCGGYDFSPSTWPGKPPAGLALVAGTLPAIVEVNKQRVRCRRLPTGGCHIAQLRRSPGQDGLGQQRVAAARCVHPRPGQPLLDQCADAADLLRQVVLSIIVQRAAG